MKDCHICVSPVNYSHSDIGIPASHEVWYRSRALVPAFIIIIFVPRFHSALILEMTTIRTRADRIRTNNVGDFFSFADCVLSDVNRKMESGFRAEADTPGFQYISNWKANVRRNEKGYANAPSQEDFKAIDFICDYCWNSYTPLVSLNECRKMQHRKNFRLLCERCERGLCNYWPVVGTMH